MAFLQHNPVYQGHIFVRSLPTGFDFNYDQTKKPLAPRLHSQKADSRFVLTTPRLHPATKTDEEGISSVATPQSFLEVGDKSELIIHLYQSDQQDTIVQLQRNSNETAASTLKRVQISLTKKLLKRPITKQSKSEQKGKAQQPHIDPPSVWVLDSSAGTLAEQVDVSDSNCGSLWEKAAKIAMVLVIPIQDMTDPYTFLVETNPPTVVGVKTFLDFTANIFDTVPLLVETEALFATAMTVEWYADLEMVGKTNHRHGRHMYIPTAKDVGKELSIVIRPYRGGNHDGSGCEEVYHFVQRVGRCPQNEVLEMRPTWTTSRSSTDANLRVLTFNVLADQNCDAAWHSYCEKRFLQKNRRLPLIVKEIISYKADIMCLQEVDEHIFRDLYEPIMNQYGYMGSFSCKSSQGQTEGCAIFVFQARLEWIDCKTHELKKGLPLGTPNCNDWDSARVIHDLIRRHPDLNETLSNRLGHILQLAHLCDRLTGKNLLVGNTHLFFHPDASHVRTLQAWAIAHLLAQESSKGISFSTILCGDFNSSLSNSCCKLLVQGSLPMNYRELKKDLKTFHWGSRGGRCIGNVARPEEDFPAIALGKNAPVMQTAIHPQPLFTHKIPEFQATLDHIFVSESLKPLRHAYMPSDKEVGYLPSETYPSDHLSVACDLEFI